MYTITIKDKGTPKEMRVRLLALISVMEQGYFEPFQMSEMARNIVDEYSAYPEAQAAMLQALNDFMDSVIAAEKALTIADLFTC